MSEQDKLKAQMSLLGVKFLQRTRTEAVSVKELAQRIYSGDNTAFEQLNYLVHRIHGGGATFGFPDVGACAGEIEHMIEPAVRKGEPLAADILEKLLANSQRLEQEVIKAGG